MDMALGQVNPELLALIQGVAVVEGESHEV
jgi:hypothetical protein